MKARQILLLTQLFWLCGLNPVLANGFDAYGFCDINFGCNFDFSAAYIRTYIVAPEVQEILPPQISEFGLTTFRRLELKTGLAFDQGSFSGRGGIILGVYETDSDMSLYTFYAYESVYQGFDKEDDATFSYAPFVGFSRLLYAGESFREHDCSVSLFSEYDVGRFTDFQIYQHWETYDDYGVNRFKLADVWRHLLIGGLQIEIPIEDEKAPKSSRGGWFLSFFAGRTWLQLEKTQLGEKMNLQAEPGWFFGFGLGLWTSWFRERI